MRMVHADVKVAPHMIISTLSRQLEMPPEAHTGILATLIGNKPGKDAARNPGTTHLDVINYMYCKDKMVSR